MEVSSMERFDVVEGARRLGISKYTVRALIRQRKLPVYRIGRRVVLDAQDVARFLGAHRIEARDGAGRHAP
jgi:excisionase family DNA binding protein